MRPAQGRGKAELLCYLAGELARMAGGLDALKTFTERNTAAYLVGCYCCTIQRVSEQSAGLLPAQALAEIQREAGRIAEQVQETQPEQAFPAVGESVSALLNQARKLCEKEE